MSHIRKFWTYVSTPQQYATGLDLPQDAQSEEQHATGLLVADGDEPGQKYATGLDVPEEKYALGEDSAEEKYALGEDSPEQKYALGEDSPEEKYATGLELDAEEEFGPADAVRKGPLGLGASVGKGGKNEPEDVLAVQKALNQRANAGVPENGKCDSKTQKAIEEFQMRLGQFKPSGLIEPGRGAVRALASSKKLGPPPEPPKPMAPPKLGKASLSTAPIVWRGTRDLLATNILELKKGVLGHYGTEHPDVIKEIDEQMKKLGVILDKLDHRLADTLDSANIAGDDAGRKDALTNAKTILADYIKYVKSEAMIEHVDSNPFGVDTQLKKALMESLTHMAKSIG
ncbi:MAG: peptidoglycan-binding protein [Gemmataceae bacterium]|nr:peptidoglycan-binding protein [Gemmataceae bacterium]